METAGPWIELEVKRHRRRVFRDPNLGVVDATPSTHPALSRGARPRGVDGATPSIGAPYGRRAVGGLAEAAGSDAAWTKPTHPAYPTGQGAISGPRFRPKSGWWAMIQRPIRMRTKGPALLQAWLILGPSVG